MSDCTMARKRMTVIKLIVAIPVFYFSFVGLLVTITGKGMISDSSNFENDDFQNPKLRKPRESNDHLRDSINDNSNNINQNKGDRLKDNKNWEFQPPPKDWKKPFGDDGHNQELGNIPAPIEQPRGDNIAQNFIKNREKERAKKRASNGPSYNLKFKKEEEFKPTRRPDFNPKAPG